jgi:hypothetical protein
VLVGGAMSDVDLDRLEARARLAETGEAGVILHLIARLKRAEDAMNVCARCGAAVDAEVAAEDEPAMSVADFIACDGAPNAATTAAEGSDPSATTDSP